MSLYGTSRETFVVTMTDKTTESVTASSVKVEEGALHFKDGALLVAIIASGQWVKVERQAALAKMTGQ